MPKKILEEMFTNFLKEDVGFSDITGEAIVTKEINVKSKIIVKEDAVIAGIYETKIFSEMLDILFKTEYKDGDNIPAGTIIAEFEGNARTILMMERTILNILMRMSGIATKTREIVRKIKNEGLAVRIAATRKTAPGLRYFDKKSVYIGGGDTHRLRLDDAFLIKDNHIKISGGIKEALNQIKQYSNFTKNTEVEVKTLKQAIEAAREGADIIMLDNMKPDEIKKTLETLNVLNLREKILIEISGGITQENLIQYAKCKPDILSIGSLTHSNKSIDMSLEIVE
jgi:nicotinate-nucleotide pyrophosphorylase (carboxylating)